MQSLAGHTISHYQITEEVGAGGMGVVYKAHDISLDRPVALKFLPHYLTSDTTERERFHHEARAVAAFSHANIAVVYEIGEHEGEGSRVACGIGCVYYRLGEADKAFEWFEKAYENRDLWLPSIGTEPMWEDLRSDPRCVALLKKMGLRK